MLHRPLTLVLLALGLLAVVLLSGCAQGVDLVPVTGSVKGPPVDIVATSDSTCRIVADGPNRGKLQVTVKNQGAIPVTTLFHVKVEFFPGGVISLPIERLPIAAGATEDLPLLDIPGSCFRPDCGLTVTVDAGNDVPEMNEGNNSASGTCVG